jgi:ABC-type transport system involved in multi-copper enzyme maturation permease subunit
MIWMSWRQSRAQTVVAAAVLAVLAIVLLVTGLGLASAYNRAGLNACHLGCGSLASQWLSTLHGGIYDKLFDAGIAVLYLTPALIGLFWGAPLIARELETGTYRLAWNQSVTRSRWTLTKLGVGGLASVAVAGLLSLMITWWASPIDTAAADGGSGILSNRMQPLLFASRGIAPLGYAAFAFALGVALGVLLRRTIPAMALTLVLFAAVQLLVPTLVRPHLLPARQYTAPLNPANLAEMTISAPSAQMSLVQSADVPGGWILSNQTITPAGDIFTGPATQACLGPNNRPCISWIASQHLRQLVTYQPASRFWPLQFIETAMYLVASAGLGGICIWRIRRKRA